MTASLLLTAMPAIPAFAAPVDADFQGSLASVASMTQDEQNPSQVNITFNTDSGEVEGRITFLEDGIFHYVVDPSGEFDPYATPNSSDHTARIQAQPDDSDAYESPQGVTVDGDELTITAGDTTVSFDRESALMTVSDGENVVMQETAPIQFNGNSTVQYLEKGNAENFFGGGMQNGRYIHTGSTISIPRAPPRATSSDSSAATRPARPPLRWPPC